MSLLDERKKGVLFVLSAPSGAGKTTVAEAVTPLVGDIKRSVSFTTRRRRNDEVDGVDYHFVDQETFGKMIDNDDFLEWAEVHGNRYGTTYESIQRITEVEKCDMLLVIDVQGAESLRKKNLDFCGVFLLPPSLEELEKRLVKRGGISEVELKTRLSNARYELLSRELFDYLVVNDTLDAAVDQLRCVITAERLRGKYRSVTL